MATFALRGCASLAGRARTLLGAGVAGPRVLLGASLSGARDGAGERKYSAFAAAAVARAAPVPRPPGLESVRAFRPSIPAADSVTIAVPEMGDSITEGEIATIVKQPGEAIGEDEVIAQVETDKVTIDIRSPGSGVVQEILVKEEDTVVVGQAVATVSLGEEGVAAEVNPAPAAAMEADAAPVAAESKAVQSQEAVESHHEERAPSIQFPQRRTSGGQVISMLTVEDRIKLGLSPAVAVEVPSLRTPIFTSFNISSDPSWKNYMPNYEDHLRRRPISEREIESIMLGGAGD